MKIFFRVDSSAQIGTGHLMRCTTLARELKKRGAEVAFICRVGESAEFKIFKLPEAKTAAGDKYFHSAWLGISEKEDAEQTAEIAKGAALVIVDHYGIGEEWENIVKQHVSKLMAIDDIADRKHACDILLDQNYYVDAESRYQGLVTGKKLLGPSYSLLRDEFAEYRKAVKPRTEIENIFINFGGVDQEDYTGRSVAALNGFDGEINVVVGNAYGHYDKLSQNKNIKLHRQISNMAELMAKADLAIGAGGSTTWERCGLGLPTIIFSIAENQKQIASDVVKFGAAIFCEMDEIREKITQIDINKMSLKCLELVDCKGAQRTVDSVYEVINSM